MDKHFEDARYYLKRAREEATKGLREELASIEERVEKLVPGGEGEAEPEPSRLDEIQQKLDELEDKAEAEARRAITSAKHRVEKIREKD